MGAFSLRVGADAKFILVSYMGYETEKIDISAVTKKLSVVLKESPENLQEIVLTGYQKIEKRKMTSAYAKVEMTDINQAGVSSVDQMLVGQLSGVVVQPTSGGTWCAFKNFYSRNSNSKWIFRSVMGVRWYSFGRE
ncbi:hypothetical protein [Algibacter lectus]|uniref:hypothetical protein n=1 Tax=Algibacter lectus TaxID=221126 RepID=UPI0026BA019E